MDKTHMVIPEAYLLMNKPNTDPGYDSIPLLRLRPMMSRLISTEYSALE